MLQIISGKFFESDDRIIHNGKGILFSNYSWIDSIETCVATLEPVDAYTSVNSYVVNYVNQIEKEKPPQKNILIRIGDAEIVEQFMLITSFALKSFFHVDRNVVAVNCRDQRSSASDYYVPSKFVPRIYSRQINGTSEEVEEFKNFVDAVIGLKRNIYNSVMNSLRSYFDALQVLGNNLDLAYSLLIYTLEALAQQSDNYIPVWNDYPSETKDELDKIFTDLDESVSLNIKSTLLKSSVIKNRTRFLQFVQSNISDEFFINEAPEGFHTIRKSELESALSNAYTIRSKFAHALQPIQAQLKNPQMANGDVIRFSGETYLSFAGLIRIVRHVIKKFVREQNKVSHEVYNWRANLPGVIQLELAPEYWIWKHEGFKTNQATKILTGFLSQLQSVILESKPMTDIRELLYKYEKLFDQASLVHRLQMMTIYVLYNSLVADENKCNNHSSIIDKHINLFEECSIEAMVTFLILGKPFLWKANVCDECLMRYQKTRHRKNNFNIPQIIFVAIMVEIASLYFSEGNESKFLVWMQDSLLESSGKGNLQTKLKNSISEKSHMKGYDVFSYCKSNKA